MLELIDFRLRPVFRMGRFVFLFSKTALPSIILALLLSCQDSGNQYRVDWTHSLKEASEISKRENSPILINFHSEKCYPCKRMDKEFFTLNSFGEFLEKHRMIPLFLDVEKDRENMTFFMENYNITGMPTLLILDSAMNEIGRSEGFQSSRIALGRLESVMKDWKENPQTESGP